MSLLAKLKIGNSKDGFISPVSNLTVVALACSVASCSGAEQETGIADESGYEDTAVAYEEPAPEPIPTCDNPPANGATLTRDASTGSAGHTINVLNGSRGNAIINIRDWETRDLVLSFYIEDNKRAVVSDIPNGNYLVQYAFGDELGEDCKSFANMLGASQDPEMNEFPAGFEASLEYELLPSVGGNFTGEPIDLSEFTAE